MATASHNTRLTVIFVCLAASFLYLFLRLSYLQLIRSPDLHHRAALQHQLTLELPPKRGAIYDRHLTVLAHSLHTDSVYAMPRHMEEREKPIVARRLAQVLNLPASVVLERLRRPKGFVWIARRISQEQATRIKGLRLPTIEMVKESKRFYPGGFLASHIIGVAGIDNHGLDGMELVCDAMLRGQPGYRASVRDGKGRPLPGYWERVVQPVDGQDVVLTIDTVIQHIAERELDKAFRTYHAIGGTIIVMHPANGEILALANRPTYDLNAPGSADASHRRNRAITDLMEPGSVFKVVTASGLLAERLVSVNERFFCENGEFRIPGGHLLHDHKPHGWLTFREVIALSSNIGTAKAAWRLGPQRLYEYIRRFGFGQKTKIELPGEVAGLLHPPSHWSKLSMSLIPIGQEVAVTPMQLGVALSALANGGFLVRPHVIKEVRAPGGSAMSTTLTEPLRQIIPSEISQTLRAIMAMVVEEGTGKLAVVPGYSSGGKTGTAQKVDPDGHYSHSRFVASFAGFAPVEHPALVIVVTLDEPHPQYYGGVVAAPVFSAVAKEVLRYVDVPPDRPVAAPQAKRRNTPQTAMRVPMAPTQKRQPTSVGVISGAR